MKSGSVIGQVLPLFLLLGIGEIAAGGILSNMISVLKDIPGLVILVPAVIALRGYIGGTLGSRLGSDIHLGLITEENIFGKVTKTHLKTTIILSMITSLLCGVLAHTTAWVLGVNSSFYDLVAIAFFAGVISSAILSLLTVAVAFIGFKRGLDPDNVITPTIATLGDVLTVLILFMIAALIGGA
jgi:mgtE-like transporter